MGSFDPLDLWYNSPLLAVTLAGLSVLIAEGIRRRSATAGSILAIVGLAAAIVQTIATYGVQSASFNGMMRGDVFGSYLTLLFLIAGVLTILGSREYLVRLDINHNEYNALVLFAIAGMILMACATDLVVVFLGIELMSLAFYVMAGFIRKRHESNESSLKYFLLGAFATGFLLYGIALLYGRTGSTNLDAIQAGLGSLGNDPIAVAGIGFLLIGLAFKIAAVPFHMWAPDVYEGAPTPVTAFMATAGKAAAFAAMVSIFMRGLDISGTAMNSLMAALAAASMVVGNITAIAQKSVKRMLAYSSIAHAGYLLAGVAAANAEAQSGILFYLGAYLFMNVGAFTIAGMLERNDGSGLKYEDYEGLSRRDPLMALLMSVFMFALTGIPPLAGFFGKYYVFLAAVKADMVWLAVLGVLTSLVSAYYYLRLVVVMYFRESEEPAPGRLPFAPTFVACLAALLVIVLGVLPSVLLDLLSGLL